MRVSKSLSPQRIFHTIAESSFVASYFIYLCCVIFVGDYYLRDYSTYAFWVVLILGAPFWFPLNRSTVISILICLPLALLASLGVAYKNIELGYYSAPLFVLCSILALNRFQKIMIDRDVVIYWISAGLLCFFFLFVLVTDSISSRTSLVFGPTILYRVVLFFYAVCLIYDLRNKKRLMITVFACMAFYSVLKIGSRGGIVALFFLWALVAFRYFSWRNFILILLALGGAYVLSDVDAILSSRAFYFSSDSESSYIRLNKLAMIDEFFNGNEVLFGMSYPYSIVGNYPHNIFAEFLIFHGIFAFGLLLALVLAVAKIFLSSGRTWINDSIIIFSPVMVGSLFSGSLMDNYFFVAGACYIVSAYYFPTDRRMSHSS